MKQDQIDIFFFLFNVTIFEFWIKGSSSKLCFQISNWISVIIAIDFKFDIKFVSGRYRKGWIYIAYVWNWSNSERNVTMYKSWTPCPKLSYTPARQTDMGGLAFNIWKRERENEAELNYINLDGWYLEGGKWPQLFVEKHQNLCWTAYIFNRCDVINTIPLMLMAKLSNI